MGILEDTQHIEDTQPAVIGIESTRVGYVESAIKETPVNDEEWTKAQKRYLWKLDCILLPAVSLLYFFEYLDRGNVANAKLYGLDAGHETAQQGVGAGTKALGSSQWQLVVMIFYVGLVLFQVPGCIGYRVFPPSKVCMNKTKTGWLRITLMSVYSGSPLERVDGPPPVSSSAPHTIWPGSSCAGFSSAHSRASSARELSTICRCGIIARRWACGCSGFSAQLPLREHLGD